MPEQLALQICPYYSYSMNKRTYCLWRDGNVTFHFQLFSILFKRRSYVIMSSSSRTIDHRCSRGQVLIDLVFIHICAKLVQILNQRFTLYEELPQKWRDLPREKAWRWLFMMAIKATNLKDCHLHKIDTFEKMEMKKFKMTEMIVLYIFQRFWHE